MAQQPEDAMQQLKNHQAMLIDILSCEADYVRQHAYSRQLLSDVAYRNVGDQRTSWEKVTYLLDSVMGGGEDKVKGFLELLKEKDMQSTFPRLAFVFWLLPQTSTGTSRKEEAPESKEIFPCKNKAGSNIVTEKQLMQVANQIGKTWRKIGTMALGITEVKLQQIEEDYPRDHVDRVYQMLRYWSKCQRKNATAAYLYSKLTELEGDLAPDDIDFLQEED